MVDWQITANYGGQMSLVSIPGQGSTFVFTFGVRFDQQAYRSQIQEEQKVSEPLFSDISQEVNDL